MPEVVSGLREARPPSQPRRRGVRPGRHPPSQRGADPARHARGRRLLRSAPSVRVRTRCAARGRRAPDRRRHARDRDREDGQARRLGGVAFLGRAHAARPDRGQRRRTTRRSSRTSAAARRLMEAASEIVEKGYEDLGEITRLPRRRRGEDLRGHPAQRQGRPRAAQAARQEGLQLARRALQRRRAASPACRPASPISISSTAGLQPTELIILAARPAMGKTVVRAVARAERGDRRRLAGARVLARDALDAARRAHAVQRGAGRQRPRCAAASSSART